VREFRQTWRGTRIREGKEITLRAVAALSNRARPRLDARTFAELLIECEEDRTLRAVLVGMLREAERSL
jgi:hypothetical protein